MIPVSSRPRALSFTHSFSHSQTYFECLRQALRLVVSRTHVVAARLRPRSGGGREGYLTKRTQINGCAIRASDESKKDARRACDPRGSPLPEGTGSALQFQVG